MLGICQRVDTDQMPEAIEIAIIGSLQLTRCQERKQGYE